MSPRPPGRGGPEEGTPEYDWLYGSSGTARPDDATRPGPAETRMMPAVRREERGAGGAPPPPSKPPRSRPRFRWGWLKIALLLWLVFMVAVPFWAWTKIDKVDAIPAGKRPAEQGGTTYLLVGSDSRDDLSEEEREELGTGGEVGQRTDTIMLLHVGDGPNLLMSIPRDSIVAIPGHGDAEKVNAAYAYGGPKLLVRTLEGETGIHIDHYVEIGFGGFVGMVDAVGGIEVCPKTAMKDPQAKLDIEAGCQEVDGPTALGYARSRKTYAELGDIDRARAQREVVSAIGSKALSPWTFINPVRYFRLSMATADSFAVSEETGPFALGRFGFAMTRVDGESGLTCGVPIADLAVNWDEERSRQLFQHVIDDDTAGIPGNLCTPTGMPK